MDARPHSATPPHSRKAWWKSACVATGMLAWTLLPSPPVASAQPQREVGLATARIDPAALLASLPKAPAASRVEAENRFAQYVAAGLQDNRLHKSHLDGHELGLLRPLVSPQSPRSYKVALGRGFALAVQRLKEVPGCSSLYADLGTPGPLLLGTTIYLAPEGEEFQQICTDTSAAALTRLHSHVTYLCPPFARLTQRAAAAAILHEALHYAGEPERPVQPEGLSSAEITALVKSRCDL